MNYFALFFVVYYYMFVKKLVSFCTISICTPIIVKELNSIENKKTIQLEVN